MYASPYTPAFGNWAFGYAKQEDRFSSVPAVDILMTHGPPHGSFDESDTGHLGCPHLLIALKRCKPKLHCFGHIHEGYGAKVVTWNKDSESTLLYTKEEYKENSYPASTSARVQSGKETLLVNAAIMTGKNTPLNNPWIFELALGGVGENKKKLVNQI